jgi:hypothetical protein
MPNEDPHHPLVSVILIGDRSLFFLKNTLISSFAFSEILNIFCPPFVVDELQISGVCQSQRTFSRYLHSVFGGMQSTG